MRRLLRLALPALAFASVATVVSAQIPAPAQQATPLHAPVAARQPHVTVVHGDTLVDQYFWLRERANPAVREYLEAENAYTTGVMAGTDSLQKALYDEMLGHIRQTDASAPYRRGAYRYFSKTEEGKQYPVYLRQRVAGGPEEVLLDQNALAQGHGFYAIAARVVNDDDHLLAYTVDTTGYRQYLLQVKDLRTGATLPVAVPRVTSVIWAADNHTLFFTTEDSVTKRSDRFWRFTLGDAAPTQLYYEPDELFDVYANRSRDGRMIFLTSGAKTMTEVRYLRANQPRDTLTVVLPRAEGHEYSVDFDGGRFYIRTNRGAKNFRVVAAPLSAPTRWSSVVPHNPAVKIEDMDFFAGHIVLSERENGLPYIRIIDKRTRRSHRISTPEPAYAMGLGTNQEYATRTIQFAYTSMVTPPSTFEYDMTARTRRLLKQVEVPNYDASRYEARRIWVNARDGTRVPVALVFRKGTPMDGTAPMLLYAYGSYGASMDAAFSSNRLALLDRGYIYALASIRGGGELGEAWREAGRMMNKMNTFTDFIDVAEGLVREHYTASDRLMIQGGSAGGLLMGAVVNMRPDLFRGVIAAVPFVDVINTMLDASLPLTTSEYIEWGNPNEKAAFDYMMQYSPYDNVRQQPYPAMLVEVSFNDSQVPYWEGTKFVAKIRAMRTNDNVLLLKANMGAGHGGSSGRYDRLREIAFEYAFLLSQTPHSTTTP